MTPLHSMGDLLRGLLALVPLSLVRLLFVGSLIVVLIWVLRLPASETKPADATGRWDENLKGPAAAALLIQIVLYTLL